MSWRLVEFENGCYIVLLGWICYWVSWNRCEKDWVWWDVEKINGLIIVGLNNCLIWSLIEFF